jgi:glutamyl-tRNA synthetase
LGDYFYHAIDLTKGRARDLLELAKLVRPFLDENVQIDEKSREHIQPELLRGILTHLESLASFDEMSLKATLEKLIAEKKLKLIQVAQPLRVALTGSTVSPGIYEMMSVMGRERVIQRIKRILAGC